MANPFAAVPETVHKYDWYYPGGGPGFIIRRCSREKVAVSEAGVALQASYKWATVTCSLCLGESRVPVVKGDPERSALAALWERSGGAHVLGYRASKNGRMYRRLVLWIGTGASIEELLALKGDLGGTLLLVPRRRWIATGRLARRLCEGIISHVSGRKQERLRELLAGETAGCASPKLPRPRRPAPPKPAKTSLPKASLPKASPAKPIPATPIPPAPIRRRYKGRKDRWEGPAPPPVPALVPASPPKPDPVPALGVTPPPVPIAPQRGPWQVVDTEGVVLAKGPDRRRAEELAEVLGGQVVPAGQPSNKT